MNNTNSDIKTLRKIGQLLELTASTIGHYIEMICIQEHRYTHSKDIKYHDSDNGWALTTALACHNRRCRYAYRTTSPKITK